MNAANDNDIPVSCRKLFQEILRECDISVGGISGWDQRSGGRKSLLMLGLLISYDEYINQRILV